MGDLDLLLSSRGEGDFALSFVGDFNPASFVIVDLSDNSKGEGDLDLVLIDSEGDFDLVDSVGLDLSVLVGPNCISKLDIFLTAVSFRFSSIGLVFSFIGLVFPAGLLYPIGLALSEGFRIFCCPENFIGGHDIFFLAKLLWSSFVSSRTAKATADG